MAGDDQRKAEEARAKAEGARREAQQREAVAVHVTGNVLNHRSGTFRGIVGIYQRHDYASEMRAALDRWAAHVERIIAGEDAASKRRRVASVRGDAKN